MEGGEKDQEIIEAVKAAIAPSGLNNWSEQIIRIAIPIIAQREREKALEEAAKILDAECEVDFESWRNPAELAAAIRTLKDATNE